jgi:hypothetical protein
MTICERSPTVNAKSGTRRQLFFDHIQDRFVAFARDAYQLRFRFFLGLSHELAPSDFVLGSMLVWVWSAPIFSLQLFCQHRSYSSTFKQDFGVLLSNRQ